MTKCSVVIPYYQRQPGILRRALDSVFRQSHANFDIIVVDDESPSPVEAELDGLAPGDARRITIIRQPNGGPGAARNTGLDSVPADSAYVAFLDSDDEWTEDHLKTAIGAMSLFDADCYFASITGGDAFYYHFGVSDLAEQTPVERLSQRPSIVEVPALASVMLKNWSFLHLSCMVIGAPLFRSVRFEASLRLAAEDVLFFHECIRAAQRTVLSEETGARRGEGVNIFHGLDSDSPEFLGQQFNTWAALDRLGRGFEHGPEDQASIEAYKQTARNQALWGQANLVRRRRAPQFRGLAHWLWRDPRIVASAFDLAVSKLRRQGERR
jgi:succinoglycan biosynthesis protein ExoW